MYYSIKCWRIVKKNIPINCTKKAEHLRFSRASNYKREYAHESFIHSSAVFFTQQILIYEIVFMYTLVYFISFGWKKILSYIGALGIIYGLSFLSYEVNVLKISISTH